jgi:tight adherence protein B
VIRIRTILGVAAGALALSVATASAGTGPVVIKSVDTSGFPTNRVTISTGHAGPAPQVSMTENGQTVNAVQAADGSGTAIAVAIDTSTSMKGQPLHNAIASATRFVFKQSPDALLAVYGFGAETQIAAPFPASRTGAIAALDQLGVGAKHGTAIYQAVVEASQALAGQSAAKRVLVLMTDGTSVHDHNTLAQALAAAKAAHVTVYAVSTSGATSGPLQQIASATGGRLVPVSDPTALDQAFDSIANSLGSTYTYSYQSLAQPGQAIKLSVSVPGAAPATTQFKAPGTYVAPSSGSSGLKLPDGAAGRAAIAAIAALLVMLGALVILSSRPGVAVSKRIAAHTEQKRQVPTATGKEVPKISMLHQLYVATEKVAGSLNYWKRLSFRLEQANLPLRTAEVVYIQMGAAILATLIVRLLFGLSGFLALIPLVIGGSLPVLYVRFKAKRRQAAFESQLPETLITLAASLKAGHAFNSALSSVVKDGAEPTSGELARVASEIQLGMTSEAALEAMAERLDSTNFGFVVMAVNIQRTVGGSLAEILDMVADTVRQRQQFHRKVKALTAQGRMSAYVLLAMPFVMGLAIFAFNPAYMGPLFSTTMGKLMIGVALVSMTIGGLIIRKIVSFKE